MPSTLAFRVAIKALQRPARPVRGSLAPVWLLDVAVKAPDQPSQEGRPMKGKTRASRGKQQSIDDDVAATYDAFKEFEGRRYTGMRVGRGHKWNYDPGVWTEKKVTPDQWEIHYAVTKRRVGNRLRGATPVALKRAANGKYSRAA
jgi:hypothetical protein